MNLLRLTRVRDQKNVYICPDRITSIEEDDGNTLIIAEGKNHWVVESPEDIIYTIDSRQNKTNR